VHCPAARAWHDVERTLSEHRPARTRLDLAALNVWRTLPATPFMEAHYFVNDSFMSEDQLLRNAGRLKGIPGIIVQGRYDLLCPPGTSQALANVWPGSELRIVEEAGHSLYDGGVRDAVMKSIADLGSKAAR
jgi:proline iminopeptidase